MAEDESVVRDKQDVLRALEDLLASPGWAILREDLKTRYGRLSISLHNPSTTEDLANVRFLQGRLQAIRELLEAPEARIKEIRAAIAKKM